ncbi:Uu.00g081300.m01.CDS01 [Anthostomella pinea]|uniref:Uu.00g081300.m01.CDS01 n=1 Tax=Anthostomella pinea TaxID=933095 RepID=A0AAI8YH03_9PEZI|nr:Uu.00g081300.m01.CDS01 [Anthostomella pinea]
MTTSEGLPSLIAPDNNYHMSRHLSTGGHDAAYTTAPLVAGTTPGGMSGYQSQPRSFYRVQGHNPLYHLQPTNEYPEAARAGAFDSAFHQQQQQPVPSPESSGFAAAHQHPAADAYGYVYSQNQGATGLVASPPTTTSSSLGGGRRPSSSSNSSKSKQKQAASSSSRSSRKPRAQTAGSSPEGSSSPVPLSTGSNKSKLRSASRTSKNTHHNPPATAEERRSRETHNNVEKQYRNRLNMHFESLLSALPESMQCGEEGGGVGGELGGGGGGGGGSVAGGGEGADRRVSKAEVLDMARRHIKALERECALLEGERDELRDNNEKLRWMFSRREGGSGGSAEGSGYLDSGYVP